MAKLSIIKIGGNILDHAESLSRFLKHFAKVDGLKILVHGGGKLATQLAERMGIEAKMVAGRRITDDEMLRIVTMVYAGLANKNIVAALQSFNCDAIGLSGADANMIQAVKRPVKEIDYGFAGDIMPHSVNTERLSSFLNMGLTPVFSAITHDAAGQLLNTNADTIASALATALSPIYETDLVYCFERKGVLQDVTDQTSVIAHINHVNYTQLKENGIIADGMIPKLDNAFDAINKGVKRVLIKHADDILLEDSGTSIR